MSSRTRGQLAAGLATVAVVGAIAGGIFVLGSPREARSFQLDEQRVRDLTALAAAVNLFWTREQRMPASLDQLRAEPVGRLPMGDPRTGAPYEYRPLSERRYEVCAAFENDSRQTDRANISGAWTHGTGRQCFRRDARTVR